MSRRALQRDVDVQVEATDKSGGFIGKVSFLRSRDGAEQIRGREETMIGI